MTYNEQMQRIYRAYEKAGHLTPANLNEIAAWAVEQGLWKPRPVDIIKMCAEDMSVALRSEYRTDPSGRRYRSKHAVRLTVGGKQTTLWADIDSAPRPHMERAFAQRRQQIVGDCHQLKMDVDYYNKAHQADEPIQLELDFSMDIAEIEAADTAEKVA